MLSRYKDILYKWFKLLINNFISIMLILIMIIYLAAVAYLLENYIYVKYFYISIIIMKIISDSFELIILYLFINKKINISPVLPDFIIR